MAENPPENPLENLRKTLRKNLRKTLRRFGRKSKHNVEMQAKNVQLGGHCQCHFVQELHTGNDPRAPYLNKNRVPKTIKLFCMPACIAASSQPTLNHNCEFVVTGNDPRKQKSTNTIVFSKLISVPHENVYILSNWGM